MQTSKKNPWDKPLLEKVHSLAEQFDLDEVHISELREFVFEVAKDHYRSGNRSGAAWAFKQAREKALPA